MRRIMRNLILISVLFVIPLAFVLRIIYNGAKGVAYLLLLSSTMRMIAFFAVSYSSLPESGIAAVYSAILFAVLLLQFFIALMLLVSFDCDTYFNAIQRISLRVRKEPHTDPKHENETEKKEIQEPQEPQV